jgi:hypothetical protein
VFLFAKNLIDNIHFSVYLLGDMNL